MKKSIYKSGVSLSAIAATALALGACSSKKDGPSEPDNYNPVDGTVKTELAISIGHNIGTRMSGATVQVEGNFRGIDNPKLVAFKEGSVLNTISLGSSIGTSDISNTQSSKIYSDLAIKVGTDRFDFYGKAIRATSGWIGDMETTAAGPNALNGATKDGEAVNTYASTQIANAYSSTATTALANLLNSFASSTVWTEAGAKDVRFAAVPDNFIQGTAGSANAVLARLQALYDYINSITDAELQTYVEQVNALYTGIVEVNNGKVGFKSTTSKEISNFPRYNALPDGSALLKYDETNKFSYNPEANSEIGDDNNTVALDKYIYPAELLYYVSSPAWATDTEILNKEWAKTAADWVNYTDKGPQGDKTGVTWYDAVKSTTRSIAIKHNINYGVAQLLTTVKADGATVPASDRDGNDINVTVPGAGFTLTGILVGGQPDKIADNMLPAAGAEFVYQLYDGQVSNIAAKANAASTPNYTLVYDNYAANQAPVHIALEFTNTSGQTFKGVNGMIYPDQRFYLVGTLTATEDNNNQIDWASLKLPETERSYFPQYGEPRVFIQDFTTTANVTITSLKNAYVTVPDLRASQLRLGLSVDLAWKAGMTFNINVGE